MVLFMASFLFESVADFQKYKFKNNPANAGKFMKDGLFSLCRFPNYGGEIGVWISVFIMCLPAMEIRHLWTVISPLGTAYLLRYVSGVPLLERAHAKKYGKDQSYILWKAKTNLFMPSLSRALSQLSG